MEALAEMRSNQFDDVRLSSVIALIMLALAWPTIAAFLLAVAFLKATVAIIRERRTRKLMPPAPPGLPFLGNTLQLRQEDMWLQFMDWRNSYGPIFSLSLAGQKVVVLSKFGAVTDLLDRRSGIYSDRPRSIMTNEILTGGLLLAIMPYGDRWRKMRRATHDNLNIREAQIYKPMQEEEASRLLAYFLRDPDDWEQHFRRTAASTAMGAIYGRPLVGSSTDAMVAHINELVHTLTRSATPGAHLVEVFPSMLYIPECFAKWKRDGKKLHKYWSTVLHDFTMEVQYKAQSGKSLPCLVANLLENSDKYDMSRHEIAWLAGMLVFAGSETTATVLTVFLLAMTLYPDVLVRAQNEIDEVVGRERMPNFDDEGSLPYVNALIKEVLRWRPVLPLSLPRRCVQDDWYQGYFIPKGTTVLENVWAMAHDPEYFPDPDEFRPERYLDADGKLSDSKTDTNAQKYFAFGFGRRLCAGKHLADQTVFIDIASFIWAFSVQKATDEKGLPITPSRDATINDGVVVRPAPFKCSIKPRFARVNELVHVAAESSL